MALRCIFASVELFEVKIISKTSKNAYCSIGSSDFGNLSSFLEDYALFLVFECDFSLQRALQMRNCIAEPCCGYLKHPLDSGEYVSTKIMVIRCVEPNMKQENHVLSQKISLNYQNLRFYCNTMRFCLF